MTQVGEGHETAADADGPVMTFGSPAVGEVLAERYQLEAHVKRLVKVCCEQDKAPAALREKLQKILF